jgi:hypothetical protein
VQIHYPVYVLANHDGVLVVNNDGEDCLLLFRDLMHAERHIQETKSIGSKLEVYPLPVPDAESFRHGIESLPADVRCAIWDAALHDGEFVHVDIDEVLRGVQQH